MKRESGRIVGVLKLLQIYRNQLHLGSAACELQLLQPGPSSSPSLHHSTPVALPSMDKGKRRVLVERPRNRRSSSKLGAVRLTEVAVPSGACTATRDMLSAFLL